MGRCGAAGFPVPGHRQKRVAAHDRRLCRLVQVDSRGRDMGLSSHRVQVSRCGDPTDPEIASMRALLEDGRLLGPNQSQVDTRFLLLLQRKQELYRAATELMAAGKSLDEALATLKSAIPATAVEIQEMVDLSARRDAVGDALRLRARCGEERAADAIRRAIGQAPFTIRKDST